MKVKHLIADATYHILTSLRLLKSQPKKVKDAITFYVWTGAWYAHSECLLLYLLASSDSLDRQFAISQILQLRGGAEYADNNLRPRINPSLNFSATSLINLIIWKHGEVQESSFTCSISWDHIKSFGAKSSYIPSRPKGL